MTVESESDIVVVDNVNAASTDVNVDDNKWASFALGNWQNGMLVASDRQRQTLWSQYYASLWWQSKNNPFQSKV